MSIVDAKFEETAAPSNLATSAPIAQRMDVAAFIANANDFETLKAQLLKPAGKYTKAIHGKDCVTGDGWQRIASALKISTTILSLSNSGFPGARRDVLDGLKNKQYISYSVTVRASLGDRVADAMGRCDSSEDFHMKAGGTEHKLESVAHTRAKNRAICALVGGSPSDIAEEQEERVSTSRKRVEAEAPAGPSQIPVPELIRLHAFAGAPHGTLGGWLVKEMPGFNGKSLTPEQSLRARDVFTEKIKDQWDLISADIAQEEQGHK